VQEPEQAFVHVSVHCGAVVAGAVAFLQRSSHRWLQVWRQQALRLPSAPWQLFLQSDWHRPMQLGGSGAATCCVQSVVQVVPQLDSQVVSAVAVHLF
jgi:hypothetical protein